MLTLCTILRFIAIRDDLNRVHVHVHVVCELLSTIMLLFSSLQLKVRPRDIQLCQETSSGVDASGHYQLGDLVQLE